MWLGQVRRGMADTDRCGLAWRGAHGMGQTTQTGRGPQRFDWERLHRSDKGGQLAMGLDGRGEAWQTRKDEEWSGREGRAWCGDVWQTWIGSDAFDVDALGIPRCSWGVTG